MTMNSSELTLHAQTELQKIDGKDEKVELLTFLYQDGRRYVCTKAMFEELLKHPLYFKDVTRGPDRATKFRGDAFGDPDVKKLRH